MFPALADPSTHPHLRQNSKILGTLIMWIFFPSCWKSSLTPFFFLGKYFENRACVFLLSYVNFAMVYGTLSLSFSFLFSVGHNDGSILSIYIISDTFWFLLCWYIDESQFWLNAYLETPFTSYCSHTHPQHK